MPLLDGAMILLAIMLVSSTGMLVSGIAMMFSETARDNARKWFHFWRFGLMFSCVGFLLLALLHTATGIE